MANQINFKIGDLVRLHSTDQVCAVVDLCLDEPQLKLKDEAGSFAWFHSSEVRFLANNNSPKTVSPLINWLTN